MHMNIYIYTVYVYIHICMYVYICTYAHISWCHPSWTHEPTRFLEWLFGITVPGALWEAGRHLASGGVGHQPFQASWRWCFGAWDGSTNMGTLELSGECLGFGRWVSSWSLDSGCLYFFGGYNMLEPVMACEEVDGFLCRVDEKYFRWLKVGIFKSCGTLILILC